MNIHLVDGTCELFRSFYVPPPKKSHNGTEIGGTISLLRSLLALIANVGNTHIAYAFDHVIESFRKDLFPGYKTGAGINPTCLLNSRTVYICKHLASIFVNAPTQHYLPGTVSLAGRTCPGCHGQISGIGTGLCAGRVCKDSSGCQHEMRRRRSGTPSK